MSNLQQIFGEIWLGEEARTQQFIETCQDENWVLCGLKLDTQSCYESDIVDR